MKNMLVKKKRSPTKKVLLVVLLAFVVAVSNVGVTSYAFGDQEVSASSSANTSDKTSTDQEQTEATTSASSEDSGQSTKNFEKKSNDTEQTEATTSASNETSGQSTTNSDLAGSRSEQAPESAGDSEEAAESESASSKSTFKDDSGKEYMDLEGYLKNRNSEEIEKGESGYKLKYYLEDSAKDSTDPIYPKTDETTKKTYYDDTQLVKGRSYADVFEFESEEGIEKGDYYYRVPDGLSVTSEEQGEIHTTKDDKCVGDIEYVTLTIGKASVNYLKLSITTDELTESDAEGKYQGRSVTLEQALESDEGSGQVLEAVGGSQEAVASESASSSITTRTASPDGSIEEYGVIKPTSDTSAEENNCHVTIKATIGAYQGNDIIYRWAIHDECKIGKKFCNADKLEVILTYEVDGVPVKEELHNAESENLGPNDKRAYVLDDQGNLYLINAASECWNHNDKDYGAICTGSFNEEGSWNNEFTTVTGYCQEWWLTEQATLTIKFDEKISKNDLTTTNGQVKHYCSLCRNKFNEKGDAALYENSWSAQLVEKNLVETNEDEYLNKFLVKFNEGGGFDYTDYGADVELEDTAEKMVFLREFRVTKVTKDAYGWEEETVATEGKDYKLEISNNMTGDNSTFKLTLFGTYTDHNEVRIYYSTEAVDDTGGVSYVSNTVSVDDLGGESIWGGYVPVVPSGVFEKGYNIMISGIKYEAGYEQEEGHGVPNAVYALYKYYHEDPEDATCVTTATTDEDGKFLFKSDDVKGILLLDGAYFIKEIISPNDYLMDPNSYYLRITGGFNEKKLCYFGTDPSGGYEEYTSSTITLYDDLKYALKVQKIGADTKAALNGAKFALYNTEEGAKTMDLEDLATYYKDEACKEVAYYYDDYSLETSGDEGYVTFYGLKSGTYYLKETWVPAGYQIIDEPIKIMIDNDKTNTTYTYEGETHTVGWEEKEPYGRLVSLVNEYNLSDDTVVVLPITGAAFDWIGFVGKALGILLICGAVAFFIHRRKFSLRP